MIRIQLVIVTLLVAVGAGALIWIVVTPAEQALPEADPVPDATFRPLAAPASGPDPARSIPAARNPTVSKPPSPPRGPAAEHRPTSVPTHRIGPRLVVVDGESGKPVAGAKVRVLMPTRIPEPWAVAVFRGAISLEAALRRFATEHESAEDGSVPLAPFLDQLIVEGRHGDRWDRRVLSQEYPPREERWRLELAPVREVSVKVVNATDEPQASVNLEIAVERDYESRFSGVRAPRAVTAADGTARLRVPSALIAHARNGNRVQVRVDVPGIRAVRAPVRFDPWPRKPIRLVLPPTARIRVHVLGRSGGFLPGPTRVGIGGLPTGHRLARDGVTVFPHVRPGYPVRIEAMKPPYPVATATGRAPERPGAESTITVRFADPGGWIHGRIVGTDGTAQADSGKLRVLLKRGTDAPILRRPGALDEEGRFRVTRGRPGAGAGSRWVQVQALDWRGIRAMSAWREVAFPESSEDVDLGEVRLVPAPLWASGRVVHEEGGPIPWVEVRVDYRDAMTRPILPIATTTERGASWARSRRYHTRTNRDGWFEVRGPVPPGRLELEFRRPLHSDAYLRKVRPGTSGLEVRMQRFGRLEGMVIPPEGLAPSHICLHAYRRAHRERALTFPGPGGRFANEKLVPGTYDIDVRVAGIPMPVVRLPDVRVPGADTARDPRLRDIDLRGRIRLIALTVIDPDRRPLPSAKVILSGRDERAVVVPVGPDGRTRVWTGAAGLAADVRAPGYRWKRIRNVTSSRTVKLERGPAVRVRYAGSEVLPEHAVVLLELSLEEEAEPYDAQSTWPEGTYAVLAHPTDTKIMHLDIPGRYTMQVSLRDGRKGPGARKLAASRPHVVLREQEFEVRGINEVRDFAIRVTREEMLLGVEDFLESLKDE